MRKLRWIVVGLVGCGHPTGTPDDASTTTGDFSLAVAADPAIVIAGNQVQVAVTATRTDGFAGAIELGATGLPAGVVADPVTIAAGSTQAMLTLHADASVPQGTSPIDITGTAAALMHDVPASLFVRGAAGTLDPTFGTNGIAHIPTPDGGQLALVAEPATHRLVALIFGGSPFTYELVGVTADGSLDTTFGTSGFMTPRAVGVAGTIDQLGGLALDGSGRLIVSGSATLANNQHNLVVWRLTADGATDATYGDQGAVAAQPGGLNQGLVNPRLAVRADGMALVGDLLSASSSLVGFSPDGSGLDVNFGQNSICAIPSDTGPQGPTAITTLPDNSVVAVALDNPTRLFRADASGAPIASFGTVRSNGPSYIDVRPRAGGGFVVGAQNSVTAITMDVIAIDDTGKPDPSFAGGSVDVGTGGMFGTSTRMSQVFDQPGRGALVVGTVSDQHPIVARFLSDGTLDPSFGTGGVAQLSLASVAGPAVIDELGRLVVMGNDGNGLLFARVWL